jgi:hypothetical protein
VLEHLVGEGDDLLDAGGLVVVDDEAGFPGLLEEVADEGLGLQGDQVVDGGGDEEDAARGAGEGRAGEGLDPGARQAQLEAPRSARRSTP